MTPLGRVWMERVDGSWLGFVVLRIKSRVLPMLSKTSITSHIPTFLSHFLL